MKRIFVDEYGDLRPFWIIATVLSFFLGGSFALLHTEAKHKAEYYTQLTGKPMSISDAFWISPEFNVSAGGEITVKVEEK